MKRWNKAKRRKQRDVLTPNLLFFVQAVLATMVSRHMLKITSWEDIMSHVKDSRVSLSYVRCHSLQYRRTLVALFVSSLSFRLLLSMISSALYLASLYLLLSLCVFFLPVTVSSECDGSVVCPDRNLFNCGDNVQNVTGLLPGGKGVEVEEGEKRQEERKDSREGKIGETKKRKAFIPHIHHVLFFRSACWRVYCTGVCEATASV